MTTPTSAALVHACFNPTYASARAAFLQAADRAGARTDVLVNERAQAPDGSTLATDVASLGPDDARNVALIVSGTHGPEGFMGSAAQIALLDAAALGAYDLSDTRIVLVHAINPWGFAHVSRTTENNVDLNRNFIDWSAAQPDNALYTELHPILCPDRWSEEAIGKSDSDRDAWIEKHGHNVFVDVTARGQYSHADGLHYGGAGREWSNHALETIVSRHLRGARRIGLIDWHTGIGERGQPFFLCFNEHGSDGWERACNWWGRENVESKGGFDGASRPNYSGLLFHGVQRFAAEAEVTGAVIEFGTKSRHEMRRALQMDRYLKFGGPLPDAQRRQMREELLDAFAPLSPEWKRSVLGHAMAIQNRLLGGMREWARG